MKKTLLGIAVGLALIPVLVFSARTGGINQINNDTSEVQTIVAGTGIVVSNDLMGNHTISTNGTGGSGTSSPTFNTVLYIPTPAQGYSASTCAASTTANDYSTCVQALYNSQIGVASSTTLVNQISTVPKTSTTEPIVFGDPSLKVTFEGQAGGGTTINVGVTGTSTFLTFNGGGGIAAGWGMKNITLFGSSANASTTLVEVGGSNTSQGFTMTGNNLSYSGNGGNAGVDLAIGSNTWAPVITGNNFGPAYQTVVYNGTTNAGEGLSFYGNDFYNFSSAGNGAVNKCAEFAGTTLLDVSFHGDHFDNCQLVLDANSGSAATINTYGVHYENPGQNTIATYPFINITGNSGRNSFNSHGDVFLQGAATPPSQYVLNAGNFYYDSPTLAKYSGAGTTTDFITLVGNGTANGYNPITGVLGFNQGVSNIIGASGLPGILQSGNVGFGTTTPAYPLVVQGPSTGNVAIGTLTGGVTYGAIGLAGDLSTSGYNLTSGPADTNFYINRPTGKSIQFKENNGAAQVTIAGGGDLGIGTTTPATTLDVNGTTTIESGRTHVNALVCYLANGSLGYIAEANLAGDICLPN